MAEPVHLDIQDCDLSPQTYCHSGCIQPGRSSTYDGNLAWVCAGYAAQKLSPASLSGLQMMSSRLHGQAARYLTHRREEGKRTVLELNCLIGYAHCLAVQQCPSELRSGSQMQEGEENLVLSQERVFGRKRLLHLDDHLSPFVDCLGGGDKLCADGCEFRVIDAATYSGLLLY